MEIVKKLVKCQLLPSIYRAKGKGVIPSITMQRNYRDNK